MEVSLIKFLLPLLVLTSSTFVAVAEESQTPPNVIDILGVIDRGMDEVPSAIIKQANDETISEINMLINKLY